MKKNLVAIFAGLTLLISYLPLEAVESGKIGIVDLQMALNETKKGRETVDKMKKRMQKQQDIIMQKAEEVKKLRDELKTQGFMLSEQARVEKETKFRKLGKELERYSEDRRAEFVATQKAATEKIYIGIMKVIEDYAKKEGYTIVFEGSKKPTAPGSIVYFDDSIDITKEVIKLYDEANK